MPPIQLPSTTPVWLSPAAQWQLERDILSSGAQVPGNLHQIIVSSYESFVGSVYMKHPWFKGERFHRVNALKIKREDAKTLVSQLTLDTNPPPTLLSVVEHPLTDEYEASRLIAEVQTEHKLNEIH